MKKMFGLACDIDSYFLFSPSTHLQLHAVQSIKISFFYFQLLSALWSFWVFFQVKGVVFWEVVDFS